MQSNFVSSLDTPIGRLTINGDDDFVFDISFDKLLEPDAFLPKNNPESEESQPNDITIEAARQLREYFSGLRTSFTFPIQQKGTDFQQDVWHKLLSIPFGQTISYAKFSIYKPLAIRAIAAANGKNNLAIVVPCHRVIGSNGKLVGYASGLWRKQWLLQHEKKIAKIGQVELEF